jgi:methyl-accepting chemotaxis protein
MRSDSRFSSESTILVQTVDTETVRLALDGESGVAFTQDYRGVPVLSAYDHFDFRYTRWAIMAEIDEAEVRRDAGSIGMELAGFGAALFALLLFSFAAVRDLLSFGGGGGSMPDYDLDGG